MAKNDIPSYDATAANNTDVQSVDISENCSPAGINNAIREVMADLKNVDTGAVALTSPQFASASMTGNLDLGDNVRARFGSGNDLQIYHDGSDSYINDTGTGNLRLAGAAGVDIIADSGETMAKFISNGASELYHNNGKSLETTSVGVTVNGNLGIGTASPQKNLQITSSTATLRLEESGGSSKRLDLEIDSSAVAKIMANQSGSQIAFHTVGSERARFDSSGNFLVGQSASSVPGIGNTTAGIALRAEGVGAFSVNGNPVAYFNRNTSDGTLIQFHRQGSVVGYISVTTSGTAYNTSSDYRLKENVTAITNATDRLKQLNPVRFNFIADADTTVDGFLAHEVSDIVPEAISGEKDAMRDEQYEVSPATGDIYTPATDDTDEVIHSSNAEQPEELADGQQWRETTPAEMGTRTVPDYQGIDQSKLVPLLVATIQELEARIAALEA